jgi:hypothetical protein
MRSELLRISKGMAEGDTKCLHELRKLVVDLDLTERAPEADNTLFLALYISKRLTLDVWENLATDASFDFERETLKPFVVLLGASLQGILLNGTEPKLIFDNLGNSTRWLFNHFYEISMNPRKVGKGGEKNEPTRS